MIHLYDGMKVRATKPGVWVSQYVPTGSIGTVYPVRVRSIFGDTWAWRIKWHHKRCNTRRDFWCQVTETTSGLEEI